MVYASELLSPLPIAMAATPTMASSGVVASTVVTLSASVRVTPSSLSGSPVIQHGVYGRRLPVIAHQGVFSGLCEMKRREQSTMDVWCFHYDAHCPHAHTSNALGPCLLCK